MILKLARSRSVSYTEALNTPEGQYIAELTRQLPPDPPQTVEDAAQDAAPEYLVQAAQQIAKRDGIPVERAYARIRRERPELAARYRREIT
jgi:hypothetical protein